MTAEGALLGVLEESRRLGFLGPGPVIDHVGHAERVLGVLDSLALDAVGNAGPGNAPRCVDLGSGGGVPGLVLAARRPAWRWLLLDAQQRRTDFLADAVRRLGLGERVEVLRARAEVAGRDTRLRGAHDLVVARSFGAPAVTAECAAPLLALGGSLAVSEPPDGESTDVRWPADGLTRLGLARTGRPRDGWVVLRQEDVLDDRYPRTDGRPAKRPLWT